MLSNADILPPAPTPGFQTTEFWSMVIRHAVAVTFVAIGAFTNNQHSALLIAGGMSLLGVDAGFYSVARTWLKAKHSEYTFRALGGGK